MSKVQVKLESNMTRFVTKNQRVMDNALSSTGVDILRLSKMQVPHESGNLQNTGLLRRIALNHYEVSYNESGLAPYARRWEYTRPLHGFKKGRKSHFLSDPAQIETSQDKMARRFQQAASSIGARV